MKYAFSIVAMVVLFPGAALYSQQAPQNDPVGAVCLSRPSLPNSAGEMVNGKGAAYEARCHIPTAAAKARYFAEHSTAPGALVGALFTAELGFGNPPLHYPSEWKYGIGGFGRFYGDTLAFQTAAQTGRFLAGVVFHEDPRYSPATNRNALVRAVHALVFTVFDKSDSGRTILAFSDFAGAASAGFVGTAYLPAGYNNSGHALDRMGIALASFAASNLASEFAPELRQVGRRLHLPQLILGTAGKKPVLCPGHPEILAGGN